MNSSLLLRLLRVLAAVQLGTVAVALVAIFGDIQDRVSRALAGGPEDLGEAGALVVVTGAMVSATVAAGVALLSLILAGRVTRGSRLTPIATWVLGVFVVAWAGGVAVANPAGGPLSLFAGFADTNGTLTNAQLREQINAALPPWYQPVHIVLALVSVAVAVAMLAVVARSRAKSDQIGG